MQLKLPWWLSGNELTKLKSAASLFWQRVFNVAVWPLSQIDPQKCESFILPLLAWQRDIVRFKDEAEEQYRLRIKYAYANAWDAGSVIGFKRIFARLGLGYVDIAQRLPDKDWDVIVLQVSDSTIAQKADYMRWLIQTYGRTCRRYEWSVMTPLHLYVTCAEAGADYQTVTANL